MATATAARSRPVRTANFVPKRERKRVRKSLIRAALANKSAEIRQGMSDRAAFYRNLRVMKQRRLMIANQLQILAGMVFAARGKVDSVVDRLDGIPPETDEEKKVLKKLLDVGDEVASLGARAERSVGTAADEFSLFARQKIYYTEVVG